MKETKNETLIFDSLPKKFLFLAACLITALLFITCSSNGPTSPPTNANSNITPISSNIDINSNAMFTFAENSVIDNFAIELNIEDFYSIDNNYDVSKVFVGYQTEADISIFNTNSLTINTNDPANRFISWNINFSNIDFETPTDEDSNNIYELASFVITNVDGVSNSFVLQVIVVNLIDLITNQGILNVNVYTSNLIDLAELVDTNEEGDYTYQLVGTDALSFKIENNLLTTVNDLGFRNIYENAGQYNIEVNYVTSGRITTFPVTVNLHPIYRQVIDSADWNDRGFFQSVVLNNDDILVLGRATFDNNIWLSSNGGLNWSQIPASSRWSSRSDFQTVVLANNDILVMGGHDGTVELNDIWLSENGSTNWNQMTNLAPWSSRSGFQTVVLANNDILIMGGADTNNLNDVWLSGDGGTNWSQITASASWSARSSFQAVVLTNNDILVMGGNSSTDLNDISRSSDGGTNWSQITASAPWGARASFQAVVLNNNDVLVIGGGLNDIWLSKDSGRSWREEMTTNWLQNRTGFQAVVLANNDLLIMGGFLGGGALNDVWIRERENTNF